MERSIQEETPSLTNIVIREMWEKCFRAAKRGAEGEMSQKSQVAELSWEEVFEEQYGGGEEWAAQSAESLGMKEF